MSPAILAAADRARTILLARSMKVLPNAKREENAQKAIATARHSDRQQRRKKLRAVTTVTVAPHHSRMKRPRRT